MGDDVAGASESIAVKRKLGASLKAARLAVQLSTTRAAEVVGISQASVSRIENGKQAVTADQLRQMATVYQVGSSQLSQWLQMLIQMNAVDRWWHEEPYQRWLTKRYAELIGVEDAALAVMVLQLQVIPGLLTTPDYTRALLEGSPLGLASEEIDALIEVREIRQQRLSPVAARSLQATFILSQAVLEIRYSSEEVHRAQMRRLEQMANQGNITIMILPFDRMIDLDSSDLYDLPGGAASVAFTDSLLTNAMVQTIDDVERVRGFMLMAQRMALSPAESRSVIRQRMDVGRVMHDSNELSTGHPVDLESSFLPDWRKSSYSQGSNACVEAATNAPDGQVWVRDSKDPDGAVLRFTSAEWRAFVAGVLDGQFGA